MKHFVSSLFWGCWKSVVQELQGLKRMFDAFDSSLKTFEERVRIRIGILEIVKGRGSWKCWKSVFQELQGLMRMFEDV